MTRKLWAVLGLTVGLSVPVAFIANPASAATSDAIAQALVTATLQNLGLNDVSPELSQQLTGQLTEAIDAGVIDPEISSQVASLLENPALISGLSDVFNAHLQGETSVWRTSVLSTPDSSGSPEEGPNKGGSGGTDSDEESSRGNGSSGNGSGSNSSSGEGNGDEGGETEDSENSSGEESNSGSSGNGRDNENEAENEDEDEDEDSDRVEDDSFGLPGSETTAPLRLRRTFTE